MYREYKTHDFMPSRQEMIDIIRDNCNFNHRVERVRLIDSLGRVSAENVYSKNVLPNKPVSEMDGIGVRFDDFKSGIPDTSNWTEGNEYNFSNTGVAINYKYDTVIMIESVRFNDKNQLQILECPLEKGQGIGKVGNFIQENELLVSRGQKITPPMIGLLASGGIQEVDVIAKPKVSFIPTGDELIPWRLGGAMGKNIESNSIMLEAFLIEWGAQPIIFPIIGDDHDMLRSALEKAIEISDIVVINAGSSKGSKDYTVDILEEMGEVLVYELGHGPGKHCSFTIVGDTPVIGIAGPPGGAEITSRYYVKQAVNKYLLQPQSVFEEIEVTLDFDLDPIIFDFCVALHISIRDGEYIANRVMFDNTRPHMIQKTNGNLYLKKGDFHKKGDKVKVELICPREYIVEENI